MKIESYLRYMAEKRASDLFLTTGAPPSIKIDGELIPVTTTPLERGVTARIANELMDSEQRAEFTRQLEMNVGFSLEDVGRFRINIYRQRGEVSIVIRYIRLDIASPDELGLPPVIKSFAMEKKGLLLVVGATGSGKSTTLASLIDARNQAMAGHILTIEDPIEFAFSHKKSIVSQREVGIDTLSYANALREALREAPDVIMIGEIRDRESMEAALSLSDTGHLVLATLHAVNANQALDRIINMFPQERHAKLLQDLSLNLRAIVSQRLIKGKHNGRVAAVEVLVNTPFVSELIAAGKVSELKGAMENDTSGGMQTFDQALIDLFKNGLIGHEETLANADSPNNIKWQLNYGVDLTESSIQPSLTSKFTSGGVDASAFDLKFNPSDSSTS